MRVMAVMAVLLLPLVPAPPCSAQDEYRPAPEALARARTEGERIITVLVATIVCLPPARRDAEDRNAALALLVRQFETDFGGLEFWRGWIRGYLDAGFATRTAPAPTIGSVECRAVAVAAARTIEEAWARDRLSRDRGVPE